MARADLTKMQAPTAAQGAAQRPRVLVLARKALVVNTRIFKQSASLVQEGYDVTVIGLRGADAEAIEQRDGFTLVRLQVVPPHALVPRRVRIGLRKAELSVLRVPMRLRRWSNLRRRDARAAVRERRVAVMRRRRLLRPWKRRSLATRRSLVRYAARVAPYRLRRWRWRARSRLRRGSRLRRAVRRALPKPLPADVFLLEEWEVTDTGALPAPIRARLARRALRRRAIATATAPLRLVGGMGAAMASVTGSLVLHGTSLGVRGLADGVRGARAVLLMVLPKVLNYVAWPSRSVGFYRAAWRYATQELPPPDVIHCNDADTLWVGIRLARRYGVPLVYDAQELYTGQHTLPRWYRAFTFVQEAVLIRFADRFVVVNHAIGDRMARRYRRRPDAVVLNCPPYEETPRPAPGQSLREQFAIPDDQPVLLYSGGLTKRRGIEATVLALRHLPRGVLVLLGEGPLRPDLERLVEANGLQGRVFFRDFVAHTEVPSLISSADVGIIPYERIGVNHFLCSPSKMFHYIMAELPVACSDFPFLRRVIVAGGLGVGFDPARPESIAAAVAAIVDDPAAHAAIKRRLAEAKRTYNWEVEGERFLDVYRSLPVRAGTTAVPRSVTCQQTPR